MKKTILSAALVAVMGVAAFAPKIASAADGTITFTGNITATTCTITGGGAASGTGDIQVDMPTVSTAALPSGATAGDTNFSLVVGATGDTNCTNGKTASLWVDASATQYLDTVTGALMNGGTANNVEVQLVNPANLNPINLADSTSSSNQPSAVITGGTATLNYTSRYKAVGGDATEGSVNTFLTYSMQYN